MKWFKHYTDSLDDPFVQELIINFKGNGYMVYFGIIEMVCAQGKKEMTGKATFHQQQLANKFSLRWTTVQLILNSCATQGKLNLSIENKKVTIEVPKILEIKDNYTKDLQATSKKLSNQEDKDKDKDKDKEEDKHTCRSVFFEEDWLAYPRKEGNKKTAKKDYLKTVNSDLKREQFLVKMGQYVKSMEDKKFLMYGSTFFHQWEDLEIQVEEDWATSFRRRREAGEI
jgi:hypothetical protein